MEWKELWSKEVVGAVIGAAGAFWAALWVARDARTREARSAAMVVIATLQKLVAADHGIRSHMPLVLSEIAMDRYISDKLVRFLPTLDPMYGACVARLMPTHLQLAAELTLLSVLHENVSVAVGRLRADLETHGAGDRARSTGAIELDERLVADGLRRMQPACAISSELLQRLVLSRYAALQRLGMALGLVGSPGLKVALKRKPIAIPVSMPR